MDFGLRSTGGAEKLSVHLTDMQTQDAPAEIIFKLWPWLEANKTRLIAVAAGAVLLGGVWLYVSTQREQKEIAAGQALTQLLVTPTAPPAEAFTQLANRYPGTIAGQRAWLHAATELFGAGRYAEAQAQFQKLYAANPTGPLAGTAELGVAASYEAQGSATLALAATAYQKVAAGFAGTPNALTAEFGLGRVAEQQGQLAEAARHFESVARSGNTSLASEAAVRAAEIKSKLAATQPAAVKP